MRPPQEFLDWLDANYGWTESTSWKLSHARGEDWKGDPVFQYWEQNILPAKADIENMLADVVGSDKLAEALQDLILNTSMTLKESKVLYNKFEQTAIDNYNKQFATKSHLKKGYLDTIGATQEVKDYLGAFTSDKDLADRINQLNVDQETKANIYDNIMRFETTASKSLRGAQGRALTAREEAQEEAQQFREKRAGELSKALDYTYNNPLVDQKDLGSLLQSKEGDAYLRGESDSFIQRLADINTRAMERRLGGEQAGRAILAGRNQSQRDRREWERPPVPKLSDVIDPYVKGTYGEGTRLRGFIESEIPRMISDTGTERANWWRRMNPEPEPEEEGFEGESQRLQSEADYWQRISENAPSSPYTAGTYWGEGGLAGIAKGAYEDAMRNQGNLRRGDFPSGGGNRDIKWEEDPLSLALKRKKWLPEYYKRPGTGLVSRLTPAVRY